MSEEVEFGAKTLKVTRCHGGADIRASRGADDHLSQRRCIDTLLEQAMEEATIPSDVVFAAPSQDERAIESGGKF